jgi:branched-chain amino acid transport system ATP-binding protein
MVEQNARMALSIADRGYVLQTGRIALADTAANLLQNAMMQEAYLGTGGERGRRGDKGRG